MPFLSKIVGHPAERIAIIDAEGEHSYGSIVQRARELAGALESSLKNHSGDYPVDESPRIAFLAGRRSSTVVSLLAIWLINAAAVPLDPLMSLPEWQWRLQDLDVGILLCPPEHRAEAHYLSQCTHVKLISTSQKSDDRAAERISHSNNSALIIFSHQGGGRPVPVVHTFGSLLAQTRALIKAYRWQSKDRLLHVLPLSNHHGLVSALLGSMAAGSCCELMEAFKVEPIWQRLSTGDITLFTAVPTMYHYLLDAWNKQDKARQARWLTGITKLRLAIVEPQPVSTNDLRQWEQITGHPLHFRYGIAECAAVLHSILSGAECRGVAGIAVSGVSLRLVDHDGHETSDTLGELEVHSLQLFSEYFGNTALTRKSFNHGWFRTGLLAIRNGEEFQLQGHRDLDVIKTGGYRVSALEIESILQGYPGIRECAVLGVPCDQWGEVICAFIVQNEHSVALPELKEWLAPLVPSYKAPTYLKVLESLPKNRLGAVDKQFLKRQLC